MCDSEKIHALADSLIASCDGGAEFVIDVYNLSYAECALLDTLALECYVCNQWFPAADVTENVAEDGFREYVCKSCCRR